MTKHVLTAGLLLSLFPIAQAAVVLQDTFIDADGIALGAHGPDITSTDTAWSGSGAAATISGNAIRLNSNGQRADIGFSALGPGEVLTLRFATLAGTNFGQTGGQGWELALQLTDGSPVFAIGDHRADYRTTAGNPWGAPTASWMVGDTVYSASDEWGQVWQRPAGGNTTETVEGEFSYIYDTGAWTLQLKDTSDNSTIWTTDGTNPAIDGVNSYAPSSRALAKLSFTRESARAANLDWIEVDISTAVIPEPASLALLSSGMLLLLGTYAFRRR